MKRKGNKARPRRGCRGVITIEMAVGSIFLIVMTALAVDITLLMIAYEINDRACRNACRAAAQQSDSSKALQAAQAVLNTIQVDGQLLKKPTLLTGSPNFIFQDYGGDPRKLNPFVTVTTQMLVRTPVPIVFFGADFNATSNNGYWTFQKRYSFPIVKVNLTFPS